MRNQSVLRLQIAARSRQYYGRAIKLESFKNDTSFSNQFQSSFVRIQSQPAASAVVKIQNLNQSTRSFHRPALKARQRNLPFLGWLMHPVQLRGPLRYFLQWTLAVVNAFFYRSNLFQLLLQKPSSSELLKDSPNQSLRKMNDRHC
mmetsp:Transcript_19643/g.45942  ORF Transcript_19643/g.45942 Transcript_19643/m.45942 type:complete len:146 (+) Transcript_19643:1454-1891(+)